MDNLRRTFILLLVTASALLIAGCGGDSGDGDAGGPFSKDKVRVEIADKETNAMRAFFVSEGSDKELTEEAVECVEAFQDDYDQVQCWSFASEEFFDNSQVDEKTGKMVKMCWQTYAATPPAGVEDGEIRTDKLRKKFRDQYQCDQPPIEQTITSTNADADAGDEGGNGGGDADDDAANDE